MLKMRHSIEVVIAAYQNNFDIRSPYFIHEWIKKINHPITIYNKDNLPINSTDTKVVNLINMGRESHSYLYHIITNYNSLADITIFTQGNPFDHCPEFIKIANCYSIKQMNDLAKKCNKRNWPESNDDFCMFGHLSNYKYSQYSFNKITFPQGFKFPIEKTLKIFHSKKATPATLTLNWGAIFAVSRKNILKLNIDEYKELYDLHYKYCSLPWAMELIWYHIFNN